MSLRGKTFLTLFGACAAYALFLIAVNSWIVDPGLLRVERLEAQEDLHRCVGAIEREVVHLDTFTGDWSSWTDTYDFMETADPAYIEANLVDTTFSSNELGLIYYVDVNGRTVWGRVLTPDGKEEITLPEFPRDHADAKNPFLSAGIGKEGDWEGLHGVYMTARGPMMLAARPILTNEDEGPSRGTLIMGRFITAKLLDTLRAQVSCEFWIWSIAEARHDPSLASLLDALSARNSVVTQEDGPDHLISYCLVSDALGQPVLLLGAQTLRDVTQQGRVFTRVALGLALSGGLLLLIVLQVAVRRSIVAPIQQLTEHALSVRQENDINRRLELPRRDEIGTLAKEFDGMLERIAQSLALREQAERALRASESRLNAIVTTAVDGIVTLDEALRICSFNPAAENLFAYREAEVVGQPISLILENFLVETDAERDSWVAETSGRTADGHAVPLHVAASRMEVDGREMTTLILRDISELKRMNARLLHTQNLAVIGEMSASVAHEIKNPLAAISGAIQVLRDGMKEDEPRRGVLQEVLEETRRLDQTIRSLLQFSRPWTPERRDCNLAEETRRVVETARKLPRFEQIRFSVPDGHGVPASLDPVLFEQILMNLFDNAAQAMGAGEIRCAWSETPRTVRVYVSDTGPGISPENLDKVLRPFFTTRTRGTGLGLSVCRQMVEAHEGTLTISSVLGEGTEVTLEFPRGSET